MIIDAVPNVLLVVNSSWKLEGLARMRALREARGLPGAIHSVTPDYVPDLNGNDFDIFEMIALLAVKRNEV